MNEASRAFWSRTQVASFEDITADQSIALMNWRNSVYPGLLDLMPLSFPGKVVLDFGCGPGHDTVAFLLNGAKHVYAADFSPRAVEMVRLRVAAHGFTNCTPILTDGDWTPPKVDHIHAAGVIHHCEDPVAMLRTLRKGLKRGGDLWMMVYSSESWMFQKMARGNPGRFAAIADAGAPIVHAWTRDEVIELSRQAGFTATYLGSYRHSEPEGPGMSSCWMLR